MGRHLSIGAAILLCVFFLGCAKQGGNSSSDDFKVEFKRDYNYKYKPYKQPKQTPVAENDPGAGHALVRKAKSALGTPYVYGGDEPGGFDCSGLVKWAYNSVGVNLPRTAREQSVVGQKVRDVEDMRAGDIVAFRHPKRGYHTGIYVGDGKFIHSPRKRTRVRINSLSDPYFRQTLLGARRVNMAAGENLVAQANERLDKMIAEATNLTVSAKNVRARKASKAGKSQSAHNLLASKSKKAARDLALKTKQSGGKAGKEVIGKQAKKGSTAKNAAEKQLSAKNKSMKANVKTNAKANGKANAKAKDAKAAKTVAANAKKTAGSAKSAARKQDSRTVSMLNKKAQKPAQKRRQS